MNFKSKNIKILNYWFNVFSLKFFAIFFNFYSGIGGFLNNFSLLMILSNNNLTDMDVSSSEFKTLVFSVLNFMV